MSENRTESPLKTMVFATALAFACALIVSVAVHWLRPIQYAMASVDYARAVLEAANEAAVAGLLSDGEVVEDFLDFEVRAFDLESGEIKGAVDPDAIDYRQQLIASPGQRPDFMPVFLLWDDGRLDRAVLPFYGPAMWSDIHGFVALEGDLSTVAGMVIFDHGETPGIGDRIQDPEWVASWRGKRLYDDVGKYRFHVDSNPSLDAAAFAVDAITGATVTVDALDRAMADWFGADGYQAGLAELREGLR